MFNNNQNLSVDPKIEKVLKQSLFTEAMTAPKTINTASKINVNTAGRRIASAYTTNGPINPGRRATINMAAGAGALDQSKIPSNKMLNAFKSMQVGGGAAVLPMPVQNPMQALAENMQKKFDAMASTVTGNTKAADAKTPGKVSNSVAYPASQPGASFNPAEFFQRSLAGFKNE